MSPKCVQHGVPADTGWTTTVHEFVAPGSASTSGAALQLEQGRDLASACSGSGRWVVPQLTAHSSAFTLHRDRLYQYRFTPPPLTAAVGSASIPEWGQPSHADDPDHFRLQDLQEFESTDVQTTPMRSRLGEVESSRHGKRMQGNGSSVNDPAKRPRLESPLILDLIPQPHFIPAPAAIFRPVDTSRIPPYQKTTPSPIAPYDAAAVNQFLSCRFRRAAWLIPVRGNLPWDGASAAVIILEGTQTALRSPSPSLPVSTAQPCVIAWTPGSLHHLWTFLESIQQAKHLGPLSLSFHAAPADAFSTNTMSEPVWESNRPYYPQHSSKHTTGSSDDFPTDIHRAHLEDIDYIKVYHDVPYSLSLRNILDAYRYEPVNGEIAGRSSANDCKIRILKGARLVLVDERSKAAFLM